MRNSVISSIKEVEESDFKNIRDKIIIYIVQGGDNISIIANNFNISKNTIIWENNIKNNFIKPGQKLNILPISGLKYKIKKGDTLGRIAKKYKAAEEDIFDFNNLDSGQLIVGEYLIIPDGKKKIVKNINPSKDKSWIKNKKWVPTKRIRYTQTNYGWLTHPAPGSIRTQASHGRHRGVDMGAPIGSPILAAASGVVTKSYAGGWGGGYGNYIKIQHPNGVVTLYAHLSKNKVWKGQKVVKGQVIGLMGSTGRSTGSHLHFEVRGAKNPF